jgi:hypothetical protein
MKYHSQVQILSEPPTQQGANASAHLPLEADATEERTLEAIRCSAWLGQATVASLTALKQGPTTQRLRHSPRHAAPSADAFRPSRRRPVPHTASKRHAVGTPPIDNKVRTRNVTGRRAR